MRNLHRLFVLAAASFFYASAALAQNAGTVTNHAFAIGKGPGVAGYTSLLCGSAQIAVGQSAADPICRSLSADSTIDAAGAVTLSNSSTTRTHLGLAIGTNVEAWDTDLDCLAAISTTGIVKRTGSGTCSAGTVALSDLSTGTQDTVVGYFGSTTASAIAIGNCSNSLTYSTATHTFGCNTSAGTGTVTSVTCFGSAITSTGTCATAATKSDEQTGSSITAVVTPSQQQQHDSALKADVSFTAASGCNPCTSAQSYNVSSVVRNSAGNYTVSFTVAFANTTYRCTSTALAGALAGSLALTSSKAVGSIVIQALNPTTGAAGDPTSIDVQCSGRQ